MAAANPIFAAPCCYCYHHQTRRATKLSSQFPTKLLFSQLGFLPSPWNGLKPLPISFASPFYGLKEKKRKFRGKVVHASLFGVGAPEALVIGVVALLVFGPKGLAEVARNLGKTLRAFQPTIRELQDVSREFKSTLEREIGLDEVTSSTNNAYKPTTYSNETQQALADPNGTPKSGGYPSDNIMKNTLEQLAASARESQTQPSVPQEQQEVSEMQGSIPQEEEQVTSDEVPDAPSKVTASGPETAAQIQPSEKEDMEK